MLSGTSVAEPSGSRGAQKCKEEQHCPHQMPGQLPPALPPSLQLLAPFSCGCLPVSVVKGSIHPAWPPRQNPEVKAALITLLVHM